MERGQGNAEHVRDWKEMSAHVGAHVGPWSHGAGLFLFQRQWGVIGRNAVERPNRVPAGFRDLEVTGDPGSSAGEEWWGSAQEGDRETRPCCLWCWCLTLAHESQPSGCAVYVWLESVSSCCFCWVLILPYPVNGRAGSCFQALKPNWGRPDTWAKSPATKSLMVSDGIWDRKTSKERLDLPWER